MDSRRSRVERSDRAKAPGRAGLGRGMESRFFLSLVGDQVVISVVADSGVTEYTGILLWVERYTLLLRAADGREILFWKHALTAMARKPGEDEGSG